MLLGAIIVKITILIHFTDAYIDTAICMIVSIIIHYYLNERKLQCTDEVVRLIQVKVLSNMSIRQYPLGYLKLNIIDEIEILIKFFFFFFFGNPCQFRGKCVSLWFNRITLLFLIEFLFGRLTLTNK